MELEVLSWMVKGEDRKPVVREGVREELEALGWVVEGEEAVSPSRGRKAKVKE